MIKSDTVITSVLESFNKMSQEEKLAYLDEIGVKYNIKSDYEKDLDEMISSNNKEDVPLPVDAMSVVLMEFIARMLAKIASSLEVLVDSKVEK